MSFTARGRRRRAHARLYHQHGLALVPLSPHSKEPHTRLLQDVYGSGEWKPLQERPASPVEVDAWFERDPDLNLGILCGRASGGLVVADFDRRDDLAHVKHPPTPSVATHRGRHIYFRSPGSPTTTAVPWYGELRADGSYVVAPDSVHPTGSVYRFEVGLDEASLAPVEALRFDGATSTATTPHPLPESLSPQSLRSDCGEGGLEGVDGSAFREDAVARAMSVLGVTAPLGKAFRCILPGHEEARPSASIWSNERGLFLYRDWHGKGRAFYTLAEVRASIGAGRVVSLKGPALSKWYDRLFHEAGLVEPVPVLLPILAEVSDNAMKVARGFELLLGLRWRTEPGEAAPFTRSFGSAWCGLTEWEARDGFKELCRVGAIRYAGEHGRLKLWLPGTGKPT